MTFIKKNLRPAILGVIAAAILAGSYFHLLELSELQTLDFRFWLRGSVPATDKVAIIEIGDDTIKKLGRFPFDRSYHAILVRALSEAGAKAIVFDIFFSEPEEHDRELEDAIRSAGNVYLPFVFELGRKKQDMPCASAYAGVELESLAAPAKGMGHINIIPDIDGKYRRVPPYIRYGSAFYPYLSLLASYDYLNIREKDVSIKPGRYLKCGPDIKIPLDRDSGMIVNFSGKWGRTYSHYSYVDILQSHFAKNAGTKPTLDLGAFKGKVCFIGLTAVGTADLHPNPFESLYPAVGMHIEVFNSILNRRFIQRASPWLNMLILAVICVIILTITLKTKPIKGLIGLLSLILLFLISCVLLFDIYGLWIDMIYPVLVAVLLYVSATIHRYLLEWKRAVILENELGIAKKIQESFLPKKLPHIKGVDIASAMFTARQVGGDLYDFVEFTDGRLGIMIGDVSGKGVPASLFMAMVTGGFKTLALPGSKPEETLSNLNRKILQESSSNLFVTIFYSILDIRNGMIMYANGGHLPVIRMSAGGKHEFLDVKEGAPLGLVEGAYSSGQTAVEQGDVLVFYTDGITEARNKRSDMYEKDRLVEVIKRTRSLGSRAILNDIEKDVRKFEPKSTQHDDMTMIVMKML